MGAQNLSAEWVISPFIVFARRLVSRDGIDTGFQVVLELVEEIFAEADGFANARRSSSMLGSRPENFLM